MVVVVFLKAKMSNPQLIRFFNSKKLMYSFPSVMIN